MQWIEDSESDPYPTNRGSPIYKCFPVKKKKIYECFELLYIFCTRVRLQVHPNLFINTFPLLG